MTAAAAPATTTVRPRRRLLARSAARRSPYSVVVTAIAALLALLAIYPLIRVLLRLFVVDGSLDTSAIGETLGQDDLWKLLGTTLFVVVASSLVAVVIGTVLAWLNERTDARIGVAADAITLAPFIMPPIASAIGWVLLFSPKAGLANGIMRDALGAVGIEVTEGPVNIFTMYGLVMAYAVFMVPYVFLLASAGLRNVDPAIEEQSRICGSSTWRTLWKVTIPSIRPSLGGAAILLVWFGFALYSIPSVIGTGAGIEVLPVRIVNLVNFTSPPQTDVAVGLSMFIVLAVGIAWTAQNRVLARSRHATVGGKGVAARPVRLGRWKWPARMVFFAYLGISTILPIGALLITALNGFWTPDWSVSNFDLDAFRQVLEPGNNRNSLINSLQLAFVGALIGIAAAALLSVHVNRTKTWTSKVLDGAVRLPAILGSIVIGVGVILAFSGSPFNLHGTTTILLLAYVILYLPQASVASDAAVSQVGKELPEAAYISGAASGRTLRKVQLPIMASGLAAGWALLFVRMVGDLTASALLSGSGNRVVGFQILETYTSGTYGTLAALSLITTLVTAGVLIAVLAVTRRRTSWGRTKMGGDAAIGQGATG